MRPWLLVLAAGMGSRYGGLKQCSAYGPGGETLLEYAVYDALRAGFEKVVFVIRPEFEDDFRTRVLSRLSRDQRVASILVYQTIEDVPKGFSVPKGRSKPWGTAHAVLAARRVIQGPFAVINADDYYGPSSFKLVFDFLQQDSTVQMNRFGLVGFALGGTLSQWGSVSRAVCEVGDTGRLKGMREHVCIEKTAEGGIISKGRNGRQQHQFSGSETVAVNFFGFTPLLFKFLEAQFRAFLKNQGESLSSEFYLPDAVNELIAEGRVTVTVLRSKECWGGVTYPGDQEGMQQQISQQVACGVYPTDLWSGKS